MCSALSTNGFETIDTPQLAARKFIQSPLLHCIFILIITPNVTFCDTLQEQSIEQLRIASQQDPKNTDILDKLANALCMATRYDEALCTYRLNSGHRSIYKISALQYRKCFEMPGDFGAGDRNI